MKTTVAIAQILQAEGIEFLSAYPTTPVIEAVAEVGIRPVICRQERVGVDIADGYSRVTNGNPPGVFAMQYGPGAENAFSGIATAFTDASPLLVLPLGQPGDRDGVAPLFSSVRAYAPITTSIQRLNAPEDVTDRMRRAFAALRLGPGGPVMLEIPADVAEAEVDDAIPAGYRPVRPVVAAPNPDDIRRAAQALLDARHPVLLAGQGALYAGASGELIELAELLGVPVATTMAGKSAFPEKHPLALGSVSGVMNEAARHFVQQADLVCGIGTSFTRHIMSMPIPAGTTVIQLTNNPRDIAKDYDVDVAAVGDARLTLRGLVDACRDLMGGSSNARNGAPVDQIEQLRRGWLSDWMPKLASDTKPINPYRVIWEFMQRVDPDEAIVTHDSGSPRDQIMPFYQAGGPRTYLGWGKSHGLGTGLGLSLGAKLAAPDKFVVNYMGDAAFGMTGLDIETAVRCEIPILTIVLNNSSMAIEARHLPLSHAKYGTRDIGGDYADMAAAMGAWAERVDEPDEVGPALERARRATEDGRTALLEFITSEEITFSNKNVIG
ncbi:MAG: thiamine pyrophosphate-requiring protein [Chloroflexi bacterium]|nr:thiamine pyrophosphate-requiring protein [Chloroflexota bacterium]